MVHLPEIRCNRQSPIFEKIKPSNPFSVRVLGIFYRKYHKGSGRANISKDENCCDNPKHLTKHEKNLKPKQKKLARKKKGSKSRKYRVIYFSQVYQL